MFIYLDTEATGTEPDDRLCQIAFKTGQGTFVNELFNPGKPIAIEAMAVHHITNEMVREKSSFRGSAAYQKLNELVSDQNNIIVAHNAKFDICMLHNEGINPLNVICTLKLARFLDRTRKAIFEFDKLISSIYTLRYLRDPQLQRNVHRSENRIESYHQLRSTIAQVNGKKELKTLCDNFFWNYQDRRWNC